MKMQRAWPKISLWMVLAYGVVPPGLAGADHLGPGPASRQGNAEEIINFALLDHRGQSHELRRADARAVVLFFTGNGCAIARQSVWKLRALQQRYLDRGVTVWLINSNPKEDRTSLVEEAAALRSDPLPILKDETQGVARLLGVQRTGESIVISTKDWRIFYRGAIDDQFTEGAMKPRPTEKFLERALDEFLDGQPLSAAQTAANGCPIHFEIGDRGDAPVSFVKEVAPILTHKCVVCHRPGDVGSWVMSDYKKVKGMSAMMQEVILARRMPPWGADPHFGKFANDGSLTVAEAQTLLLWTEQGAPRGEGDDPLPRAVKSAEAWPLGPPDYVIRLPRLEHIPATGVLDLRHQILDGPFTNDVWIGALDFKPGNRKVLHHITLRTIYPGQTVADPVGIAGWNPGYTSRRFPEGTGQRFKKGVRFHVDLHYTTIGTPETDQTEIGFYVLPGEPKVALEGRAAWDTEISIPPGEPNLRASAMTGFDRDTWLFDFRPQMH